MKEIEVKFIEVDLPQLKKKLKRLGFRRVFPPTLFRELHFKHILFKEGRFFDFFRLRAAGKKVTLTVKKAIPNTKFKVREEREIQVAATFEETWKLLESMGFQVRRRMEKFREEYERGKFKVEIDRYPGMAPYIEIEGPGRNGLRSLAAKFGLDFKKATTDTAPQVVRKAGLDPDNIVFRKKGGLKKRVPSRRSR